MANATQKISEIIASLEKEITVLKARKEINVTMRIDRVIPYLEDILSIAKDDITTRKFDLLASATGCTLSFEVGGESVDAGANVLKYGDVLKITATPSSHYLMKSLKVNGENFTSGNTITVTTDLSVVAVAELEKFDLAVDVDDHSSVTITRGGVAVQAGTDVISYGDVLTITASASEGYTVSSLTVNDDSFVSGQTYTVSGDVEVEVTSAEVQPETPQE